jgi:hypothetical protein
VVVFKKVNWLKLNVTLKENEKILFIKQGERFLSSLHCREERTGEESQEIQG